MVAFEPGLVADLPPGRGRPPQPGEVALPLERWERPHRGHRLEPHRHHLGQPHAHLAPVEADEPDLGAQLGADRSRHPAYWPTSGQLLPDRTVDRCTCTLEIIPPNRRKQDMRMLSRPLAPRGQEAAAFTDGRPRRGRGTGDPTGRGQIVKDNGGTKEKGPAAWQTS